MHQLINVNRFYILIRELSGPFIKKACHFYDVAQMIKVIFMTEIAEMTFHLFLYLLKF